MGMRPNIDHTQYPKQGSHLGAQVSVCFNYDTSHLIDGIIVRDDAEDPFIAIIRLDDDRYVLTTECMYTMRTGL